MSETKTSRRGRSPNYPGIPLEAALEKASVIYRYDGKHFTPSETVLSHWGYATKSSSGLVALGALKQFGLIEAGTGKENRRGQVRLTGRAEDIMLIEDPNDHRRRRAVWDAALAPPLHRELWAQYGGNPPSDGTLRYWLIKEKKFTEKGAADFITEFRATLDFAAEIAGSRMSSDASIGEQQSPEDLAPNPHSMQGAHSPAESGGGLTGRQPRGASLGTAGGMNQDSITLDEGKVVLEWPSRMSRANYEDFKDWIDLMKRRIARSVSEPDGESHQALGDDGQAAEDGD